MNLPNINLEELEEAKKQNRKERLEFIDKYVAWLKKTPNKKWSSQRKFMESRTS